MIREPVAPEAHLIEGQLVDHRPHGAVENCDPAGKNGEEQVVAGGTGFGHGAREEKKTKKRRNLGVAAS
jgi:hypothetical protein